MRVDCSLALVVLMDNTANPLCILCLLPSFPCHQLLLILFQLRFHRLSNFVSPMCLSLSRSLPTTVMSHVTLSTHTCDQCWLQAVVLTHTPNCFRFLQVIVDQWRRSEGWRSSTCSFVVLMAVHPALGSPVMMGPPRAVLLVSPCRPPPDAFHASSLLSANVPTSWEIPRSNYHRGAT